MLSVGSVDDHPVVSPIGQYSYARQTSDLVDDFDGDKRLDNGDSAAIDADQETDEMLGVGSFMKDSAPLATSYELADGRFYNPATGQYIDRPNAADDEPVVYRGKGSLDYDFNLYAAKKTAAKGLLDLALLMANASQLKYILMTEGNHRFYAVMLTLILTSILLQIVIGISLLFLGRMKWDIRAYDRKGSTDSETGEVISKEERLKARKHNLYLEGLNNASVLAIFILTVINVFISAFGLNEEKPHPKSMDIGAQTAGDSKIS